MATIGGGTVAGNNDFAGAPFKSGITKGQISAQPSLFPKTTRAPKPTVKTTPRPAPKPVGSNSWSPPRPPTRSAPPTTIKKTTAVTPSSQLNIPKSLPGGKPGNVQGNLPTPPVQPPPVEQPGPIANPLSQEDWMAQDPQYLQAIADLQKALGDTTATTNAGISDYQNQLQNQIGDAETQRQQQLASMLSDYSSRGMDTSTGYQEAVDQYNNNQNSQEDALRQAIQQRIAALNSGLTDQQNAVTSGTTAAQQAAAARYQAMLANGLA